MPTKVINNPKMLDRFLKFDSSAGLFINELKENNENPTFVEPVFNGYERIILDKNNWGPAVKEEAYATTIYENEIYWTNNSSNSIDINGYFIKNTNDETICFNVFNTPASIGQNETIYVNPKIYLNNYENIFNTCFIFNIINPLSSTPLNPIITIKDEFWGETIASKSLVNAVTGNTAYNLSNNSINLVLDPKINVTTENPFSFNIKLQQSGFFIVNKNILITEPGVYENTLNMIEIG